MCNGLEFSNNEYEDERDCIELDLFSNLTSS